MKSVILILVIAVLSVKSSPPGYKYVCTKTPTAQQFSPIKSNCDFANTRVTPAFIPKMSYDTAPGITGNGSPDPRPFGEYGGAFFPVGQCGTQQNGGVTGSTPVQEDPPGFDGIDEPASGNACDCGAAPVAVDAVSLMLAQAEANRCQDIREDRLPFGPITVPKDALPVVTTVDVNEEALYALDKPIVELKTCKRFGQCAMASDTDALLALEEDEQLEACASGPSVSLPTYEQVGYQIVKPACAPLVGGQNLTPAVPEQNVIYSGNTMPAGLVGSGCQNCKQDKCRGPSTCQVSVYGR
ncbi:uncharacterized protein LOC126840266 [Adelges cooleyi]|uniref:uncharacterized protein LOC126840266 n=1 Tax=Adelges cooleyi TaxID=133065 RepID=UPI00217FDB01|nr:uncharacterized protein LOC126840266 [Adelges cooleyi]